MDEKKHITRFKKNIIPSSIFFLICIIIAFKLPLWLVNYEGKIWGGEGLFSLFLGQFILCPILAILGGVFSLLAYCKDDKKVRNKELITGGIIYIFIILITFLALSFYFYGVLGPPDINQ